MQIPLTPEVDGKVYYCDNLLCDSRASVLDVCLSLHVGSLDRRWKVVPRVQRCNNNIRCIGEKIENKHNEKLSRSLAGAPVHAVVLFSKSFPRCHVVRLINFYILSGCLPFSYSVISTCDNQ